MSKRAPATFVAYWVVCSLLGLVVGFGALAEETAAPEKKTPFADTPCSDDYDNLCTMTQGWRLGFNCLRDHYVSGELSDQCKAHTDHVVQTKRDRVKARELAWRKACAKDIQDNCSQFTRAQALKGCLYRIRDQVAPGCDEKLPYRPGHQGPGYVGWKDGSEPADFDEKLQKRLKPKGGLAAMNAQGRTSAASAEQRAKEAAAQAEREKVRAEIRARLEANRKAREAAASAEPSDASHSGTAH